MRTYSPWVEELSDSGSRPAGLVATQPLDYSALDAAWEASPRAGRHATARSRGLAGLMSGQLARFVAIGIASTLAYMLLYLVLSYFMPALVANALSMLITAITNTAANRRLTFGVRGSAGAARHQAQGLVAFAVGLLITSGALAGLHRLSATPGRATELAVLVSANLVATAVRFLLYRLWVFGGATAASPAADYS